MKHDKWEYLRVVTHVKEQLTRPVTDADLTAFGNNGWELVAVTTDAYIFKRKKGVQDDG